MLHVVSLFFLLTIHPNHDFLNTRGCKPSKLVCAQREDLPIYAVSTDAFERTIRQQTSYLVLSFRILCVLYKAQS